MNPIAWLDIYKKSGLWGCFKRLAHENHIIHWGIFINFMSNKYFIDPSGRPQKSEYTYIHQISIRKYSEDANEILIPIKMKKNVIFICRFLSKVKFSEEEINQIKFQIELLILYEASNIDIYPTFLTFLYPPSDALAKVNESIYHRRNLDLIFLNGQKGSGKASFAQCFALLHFHCFLDFNSMDEKINLTPIDHTRIKNILYIPELALLDHSQQSNLANISQNQENLFTIASSIYDLNLLFENNIISKKITDICLKERIIIPSLKKRSLDISTIIDFLGKIKSNIPNLNISQIKDLNYIDNLDGLKKLLFLGKNSEEKIYHGSISNTYANEPNPSSLEDGLKLRDMITKLEISAIKYAHEKVGDSQNKMADFLGISRGSLQHKLKKYDIDYIDWED